MKKILLLFIITLSFASDTEAFLDLGIGLRSAAMSQAYYNLYDAESAYINPALIGTIKRPQLVFTSYEKWGDLYETMGSICFPHPLANVGFTVFYSSLKQSVIGTEYDSLSGSSIPNGKRYSYYQALGMITLAKPIARNVSVGVNLKGLIKNMDVANATAGGLDIGANWQYSEPINLSVKATNIFHTGYQWEHELEMPDKEINAGVGIKISKSCLLNIGLAESDKGLNILAGVNYEPIKNLGLQAGMNAKQFSGGISLKVDAWTFQYSVQLPSDTEILDTVHRFGVQWTLVDEEQDKVDEQQEIEDQYTIEFEAPAKKKVEVIRPQSKDEILRKNRQQEIDEAPYTLILSSLPIKNSTYGLFKNMSRLGYTPKRVWVSWIKKPSSFLAKR